MRACPKCGHVDPPEWRQVPWKFDTDHCWTEDFEKLHPAEYEQLMRGHEVVCDEHFCYRFSGKSRKVVWRVWKKMFEWGGKSAFNIPMEAAEHKRDPFQKQLMELCTKK